MAVRSQERHGTMNQATAFKKKPEDITFDAICDGAAMSKANQHLKECIDDILNPRKKAKSPREVTIKIKILPDEDRKIDSIELQVSAKMAPFIPNSGERWFDEL